MTTKHNSSLLLLLLLLILKGVWAIGMILYSGIGLSPDEAQYWTWSQALDWGYYSKPPGIAWQIHLSTLLLGQNELGVRFSALLIGTLISFATYALAFTCRLQPLTCFLAAATMALSPLGFASSFFATTDGGLVLFWTLACAVVAATLNDQRDRGLLLGVMILCGALFKWTIFLLWPCILLFAAIWHRPLLRSWKLPAGILLSLLGFLPSLIWNYTHEWATFRHVVTQTLGGPISPEEEMRRPFFHGNFFDFFGAQAALVSPILFVLLIIAFVYLIRQCRNIPLPLFFCGSLSLAILLAFCVLATKQKMQANWAVFAYPSGIVFMCWVLCEQISWGKRWVAIGIAFSILLTTLIFSIPRLQTTHSPITIPCAYNPFKHCMGWDKISSALLQAGYNPDHHFLFADKYQNSSILSFYGPAQRRAYFLNLYQNRHNQFSYWPGMAQEQKEATGFFVVIDTFPHLEKRLQEHQEQYKQALSPFFDRVDLQGIYPLFFCNEEPFTAAIIFRCTRYNSNEPPPSLYF
jgi:4-amino-4-deoxy-L-arabinose transferase-like glycosyltransferase